ncbi:MAG: Homing endonuclease associated repeat [Solirubrobacteraceae bacterium]|jgi:hypothetical protein|nr:Homing endonuclease associated repeat [Solirubrobacteraceae bacterium]
MASSARFAGGPRVRRWTRELIIAKIREWNDRYGEPPSSADWNPSLARWRAQEWRAERYREGVWPSTNAAKRPFDGSFDAAVRAAGLEPRRPGPRRRPAGAARPDVAQRGPAPPRALEDELAETHDRLRGAEARADALERRLARAELRAERAEDQIGDAARRRRASRAADQAGRARRSREQAKVSERAVRADTVDRLEAAVADADARVRASDDQAEAASRDASDARRSGYAAELRAVEAEARAEAAERLAALHAAADRDVEATLHAAEAAEARARAAERSARELATLVCGQPRRLTTAELAALRDGGPSGPAVLAGALKTLARARADADRVALDAALADLASAAVRWRDRL